MYCTGVVHFANRHACVTFWTHSCPATGNSKPDSPYQPACVRSECDIGAPECTSVHGIGIVVLNKWMKCATKNQSLLASTPWSHKCHMITLVTVHDFIFHLTMTSLTHFEDIANNEDGSTCNRCACTRFKTPEWPSSYKASSRQSN